MKKLLVVLALCASAVLPAQEINRIPRMWRWTGDHQVAFIHDYRRPSADDFVVDASNHKVLKDVAVPAGMPLMRAGSVMPFKIQGAENPR